VQLADPAIRDTARGGKMNRSPVVLPIAKGAPGASPPADTTDLLPERPELDKPRRALCRIVSQSSGRLMLGAADEDWVNRLTVVYKLIIHANSDQT
jgi:hypothetical protein